MASSSFFSIGSEAGALEASTGAVGASSFGSARAVETCCGVTSRQTRHHRASLVLAREKGALEVFTRRVRLEHPEGFGSARAVESCCGEADPNGIIELLYWLGTGAPGMFEGCSWNIQFRLSARFLEDL